MSFKTTVLLPTVAVLTGFTLINAYHEQPPREPTKAEKAIDSFEKGGYYDNYKIGLGNLHVIEGETNNAN